MNSSQSSSRKIPGSVVLLRVGIDTGSGGICGPVFSDGRFEYIPIDARKDRPKRTYGNTHGRCGGKLIDYFLPPRLKERMRGRFIHFDPEFKTFTYGDPTFPKQGLRHLRKGDLLVFYAGLKGWDTCKTPPGLYIIGYFVVEAAGTYPDLKRSGHLGLFKKNWHVIHGDTEGQWSKDGRRKAELVLVKGSKESSTLLEKARQISAPVKEKDRGGHPIFVLDPKRTRVFGNFTTLNAIQRSTPRWVKPEFCAKAAKFVRELK